MSEPRLPAVVTDVPALSPRAETTHKGEAGRVAILAGSRGMSGAAVLCGLAALRGGAGLVRVYAPASIQPIIAMSEPSLLTTALDEDESGRIRASGLAAIDLSWPDVIAIGPGLGRSAEVARVVTGLLERYLGPVVIDADGLNNIAGNTREDWQRYLSRRSVITPHPGEMSRLRRGMGLPDVPVFHEDHARIEIAHEFARLASTTVVLKGHRTVVCTAGEAYINTTGNPGMATGGMGDVLTGLIAALLGQGLSPFDAARLAVYAHGAAADHLARQRGPVGYLAREVADGIPAALAEACRPRVGFR